MSDLIRRDELYHDMTMKRLELHEKGLSWNEFVRGFGFAMEFVKNAPSAEPNLIHCADCRWWKQDEDIAPYGWCFACKSGTYTEHWDIMIRRKYQGDFFCADAEPRIEGEDTEGEDDDE